MTNDYMLTVLRADKSARDVQVNGATSMHEAIAIAEQVTGCRVDHGRGGIGSEWHPAVIIDAATGESLVQHDRPALDSMTVAKPRAHLLFED